MIGLALLQKCASEVAPVTMAAIVQDESSGWPWAINVNNLPGGGSKRFPTKQAAVAAAIRYIRMGYKVDLGIAQVDSENLGWLGLSVSQVFNPCTNLQAAQKILVAAYRQAGADGAASLKGALEAYNSGNTRGDGSYAKVVYRQAGVEVPAIPGGQLAPWADQSVGGNGGMGKEGGGDMPNLPPQTPAGSTDGAPVRPIIMMPPKSWQPLTKSENFPPSSPSTHAEAEPNPVTSIWTPG